MNNSKEEKVNRQVELQKLYLRNMQIIKWRLKAIADIRLGKTKTTFKMTIDKYVFLWYKEFSL